jgi:branched-chain amino acid transport system permease protein
VASLRLGRINKQLLAMGLVVVVLAVAPLLTQRSFLHGILILVLLYAALGQAWNILGGYAGQVSLGNAIYFGLGAYTSTLLFMEWQLTPWLGALAGAVVAILAGLVIGWPTFRLTGHYFVTATLVINEVVRVIFSNWRLVGGARGLYVPIVPESWLNLQFHSSKLPYYYLIAGLFVMILAITWLVEHTRPGYYFRAIRDDPDAAAAMGVNLAAWKHVANAINAAFTAVAGTFYAQYVLFLDPPSIFNVWISVLVLLVPVLGGRGTLWGPLLGAAVLIPLSEATRTYLGGEGRALHLVVYGLLIMVISVVEPRGLVRLLQRLPSRSFERRGRQRDAIESS